jgi:hypothetical protein
MTYETSQTRWVKLFVATAIVIFAVSGWAWWHYIRSNPERTFFSAVENSLRNTGMSKTITQESGDQKLNQVVQYSVGSQNAAHGFMTVSQSGETSASIKTEVISNPTAEYVRYTNIQTDQKKPSGDAMDFSKLVGIWGKTEASRGGDLFNETVLGVVPAGNLSAEKRQSLMHFIHDKQVYKFESAERAIENGRPVYTYDVTVAPEAYVGMLKEFGRAMGMSQLESVDPSNYKDAEPLTFKLKVDVWGQQLTGITYAGGQRNETLGSYGIPRKIDVPKDSVPIDELQTKLQEAQQ